MVTDAALVVRISLDTIMRATLGPSTRLKPVGYLLTIRINTVKPKAMKQMMPPMTASSMGPGRKNAIGVSPGTGES
jgi:hypothetical protein